MEPVFSDTMTVRVGNQEGAIGLVAVVVRKLDALECREASVVVARLAQELGDRVKRTGRLLRAGEDDDLRLHGVTAEEESSVLIFERLALIDLGVLAAEDPVAAPVISLAIHVAVPDAFASRTQSDSAAFAAGNAEFLRFFMERGDEMLVRGSVIVDLGCHRVGFAVGRRKRSARFQCLGGPNEKERKQMTEAGQEGG